MKGFWFLFTSSFTLKHSKHGGNEACLERIVISGQGRTEGLGRCSGWGVTADGSREPSKLEISEARRLGMIQWKSKERLIPLLM